MLMLEHGALYVPAVLEDHEYYRMITSMFMHFGFEHLFFNMILLYYMGTVLEKGLGEIRFLLLYFMSGLIGNVASLIWYSQIDRMAVSAGASGAIFGLVGAALYLVIKHKGYYRGIDIRRLVLMIGVNLYNGFVVQSGINNAAHVGGLVSGFLLGVVLTQSET
jgi:rhomboid protease GluP